MRGYRTYPGRPTIHVTPWADAWFTVHDWAHIRAMVTADAVEIAGRGPFTAKVGTVQARGATIRAAVDRLPEEVRR